MKDTDCFDDDKNSSGFFTTEHAQRVFVQCNVEVAADTSDNDAGRRTAIAKLAKANADDSFCRYEFIEAVLRVVDAKYDVGDSPPPGTTREDHLLDCVRRFKDEHLSKLPKDALEEVDDFRKRHLYFESVDKVLWRHDRLLKEIYKTYADLNMHAGRSSFPFESFLKFLPAR